MIYEYVGFKYIIHDGKAIAMPFQHKAAYKQKHAHNAYKQYMGETKNVRS